ncbi:MAG: hypothetical protein ABJE10_00385 [bacterium]
MTDGPRTGLDHPRAVDILTTEHWSLLSTRSLGYQEILGRATIFIAIVSGVIVSLALLAQATRFGRESMVLGVLLISVALFIGVTTFVRTVVINFEDARWVAGITLLRHAYLRIVPELEEFFITDLEFNTDPRSLAHGSPQRMRTLAFSLTTTSGIVAALNSVLAGAFASGVCAIANASLAMDAMVGGGVSIVSAGLHVWYAARFRKHHVPTQHQQRPDAR